MEDLIHTTEMGRLYKPQALSPPLPPVGGRGRGPQNLFCDSKFSVRVGVEPRILPCRASYIPLSWAGYTSLKPFPLLFRLWEAEAGGLRIYFAILNFQRVVGVEPGILPCRASYIPLSWAGSLKPFPLLFRLCPPLPRLVTGSRSLISRACRKWSPTLNP